MSALIHTPRFTADEERELVDRMKAGDAEAKDLLARSVIRWAYKKAAKCGARWEIDHDELESIAHFSIGKALEKFDPASGRLTTYVATIVQRDVDRYGATQMGPVSIPPNLITVDPAKMTPAALVNRNRAMQARTRVSSLDDSLPNGDTPRGATIEDYRESHVDEVDRGSDDARLMAAVEWALAVVSKESQRNAAIFRERTCGDEILDQIGARHGITKERVRQIESALLPKVRKLAAMRLTGGVLPNCVSTYRGWCAVSGTREDSSGIEASTLCGRKRRGGKFEPESLPTCQECLDRL